MPGKHKLRSNRAALTLLELLVVLLILAIVATIAVNSLQPRVEAARFEQTQKQLNNVVDATIGPRQSRQADGTPIITGFIADVGRLPIEQSFSIASTTAETTGASSSAAIRHPDRQGIELCELWDPNSQLALQFPFQFRSGPKSPVNYSDVNLPCGWRGPYLQLPMGTSSLRDPWNQPFEVETDLNREVLSVTWKPQGSYDQPITTTLTDGKVSVTGTINFGQTIPSNTEVVMLVPDPKSSQTELTVLSDEDDVVGTFSFQNVPVGLRAICINVDSQRLLTKYIQVPHQGLSLVFDLSSEQPTLIQSDE